MATAVQGNRGVINLASNEWEAKWIPRIKRLMPIEKVPINAIMHKASPVNETQQKFIWWEEEMPDFGGAVTNVYIQPTLVDSYNYDSHQSTAGIKGALVYVKTAAAVAKEFKDNDVVLLVDASNVLVDVAGLVRDVVINGGSSYLAVQLLEIDDNASTPSTTASIQTVDQVRYIGSSDPEFGEIGDPLSYDPAERYSYSQVFQDAYALSRNVIRANLRTTGLAQQVKKRRDDMLERHVVGFEKAAIWGRRSRTTAANGQYQYTTMGLIEFLKTYNSSSIYDMSVDDTNFNGKTWIEVGGGFKFLLEHVLDPLFRYLPGNKALAFCGSKAINALVTMAMNLGTVNIQPSSIAFGMKTTKIIFPGREIELLEHPLLSKDTSGPDRMMIICDPSGMKRHVIDGTRLKKDKNFMNGGLNSVDGIKESWITDMGFEWNHAKRFALVYNMGVDNS